MVFLKSVRINKIIKFLVISDIFILTGWGLVNPILAVFFTEQIHGGSIAIAGLASTIYFLSKSLLQIPIARCIDLRNGENDDLIAMIIGSLLISLSAFLFFFAEEPWHVYLIQMINGIGGACAYPAWLAIFTRHADNKSEGFEWSLYYTSTDIGCAIAAGLGGLFAVSLGYRNLFLLVGCSSLIGTGFLFGLTSRLRRRGAEVK